MSLGHTISSWSFLNSTTEHHQATPLVTTIDTPINEELFNAPPTANTDEIVAKVLASPQILNFINNYNYENNLNSDKSGDEELLKMIAGLRSEIERVREEVLIIEKQKDDDLRRIVSQIRSENVRNIAKLTQRISRCCDNKPLIDLEPYITNIFTNLLNNPEFLANQNGLIDYLHSLFVAQQVLESRLNNVTSNLQSRDIDISLEDIADKVMKRVITQVESQPPGSISEAQITEIVKKSLLIYDADKTGLVDYAMESSGGQVLTTRCTETYTGTAVISILGIPLWHPSNSPRIAITPGSNPGECWAFQNFPGFIVIKLATRIQVDAFSLEHISRLLVPDGKIDSAPKEFEVYGLQEENDQNPVKIGEYVYDYEGNSVQFFAAQNSGLVFSIVELRIKSNHGNPNYTCLYRFRVHGKVASEPSDT